MSDNYWCQHVFRSGGHWAINIREKSWCIPDDWDTCPVKGCGAKRPEEPNSLRKTICCSNDKVIAMRALEWFKDRLPLVHNPENVNALSYQAKVLDLLNTEIRKCK